MNRAWAIASVGVLVVGCVRPTLLTDSEDTGTGTGDDSTVSASGQSGPTASAASASADSSSGGMGPTTITTSGPITTNATTIDTIDTITTTSDTTDTDDTTGDPPPVGITVEGTVQTLVQLSPVSGLEVSLFDDPAISDFTDGNGDFGLTPVPAGTLQYFMVTPAPDLWGSVTPVQVGPGPVRTGIDLAQMERAVIDAQQMQMQQQMAAPLDDNAALLVVRVLQNTAVNEAPVTISVDPPLPPDTAYAPGPDGFPILGQLDIEFALLPVMIAYNVPDTLPGDIMISASHPIRVCTPVNATFPTVGGHMTLVDVDCPAP